MIHAFVCAAQLFLSISQVKAREGSHQPRDSSSSIALGPLNYTDEVDGARYHKIVIAHAVLACLAWVLFAPLGAMFLRSGIRVNLLKLHAFWQLFVFALLVHGRPDNKYVLTKFRYIAAAGLGIWLRLQLSSNKAVWRYPHAAIGLLILMGAFFQPWFGYIHHKIFKRRLDAINAGDTTKTLGRTIITYLHLWLGRLLITLGVINGGLGIMVTTDRRSPLQSSKTSRRAAIAYGAVAGTCYLIYAGFMIRHEYRRAPLVMNTREGGISLEVSSTLSDKTVSTIEIGRRFSVFLDDSSELNVRRGSSADRLRTGRSHDTSRRGSSNEKLRRGSSNERLISGQHTRPQSPMVSPIADV